MKDFFKHYHIGCWFYRATDVELGYDPVEVQKELGMNMFTTPEHWRDEGEYCGTENLEKYLKRARELNMPTLYVDRRFFCTRDWAKPNIDIARKKVKYLKENYSDVVKGIYVCDEPWWGHQDEHKAIDACKKYVDMVREEGPDFWTFIALLGVDDRYKKARAELEDYVQSVHPDFLLYNVYSQVMAEDVEKEQGLINFYYQLYMYYEMSREKGIPLWASPMCTACWSFRKPTQEEFRWQLNVLAAHGVKGFVWYHIQESTTNTSQGAPIDAKGRRTQSFDWLSCENYTFMNEIASKLDGFELDDVYHYMFRQSNFKAFEFVDDDVIEDVRSNYHRHLIISKFKDENGRIRIMITNGSQDKNGHFSIKFKGDYAKYNVGSEAGYLTPGGAKVISLFDEAEDPSQYIPD